MLSLGSGRHSRLSRAEWHAEKARVAAAAEALLVADVAQAEADAARQDAATITSAAEAQEAAAESLRARADVAAARAHAAIQTAWEQATEAKAAARRRRSGCAVAPVALALWFTGYAVSLRRWWRGRRRLWPGQRSRPSRLGGRPCRAANPSEYRRN